MKEQKVSKQADGKTSQKKKGQRERNWQHHVQHFSIWTGKGREENDDLAARLIHHVDETVRIGLDHIGDLIQSLNLEHPINSTLKKTKGNTSESNERQKGLWPQTKTKYSKWKNNTDLFELFSMSFNILGDKKKKMIIDTNNSQVFSEVLHRARSKNRDDSAALLLNEPSKRNLGDGSTSFLSDWRYHIKDAPSALIGDMRPDVVHTQATITREEWTQFTVWSAVRMFEQRMELSSL